MTEHDLVLMIQRQRAALIAERDACASRSPHSPPNVMCYRMKSPSCAAIMPSCAVRVLQTRSLRYD